MANRPFGFDLPGEEGIEWVDQYMVPSGAQVEVTKEAGVYHLRGNWRFRGVIDFQLEGWPKFRRMVVWSIDGYQNVKETIAEAEDWFNRWFGFWPERVYMRALPKEVENGQQWGLLHLFDCDWVPGRCVALGGRR